MLQSKTEKLGDSLALITVLEIELEKSSDNEDFSELLTYINDCQRFSLIVFMKRWYSHGDGILWCWIGGMITQYDWVIVELGLS